MAPGGIPDIIISRLPFYLRALARMAGDGQCITSSKELGERLGISSAQIRKDLSHFGEFGKQGTGYEVEYLLDQLQQILRVNREWEVALVGAGDLGHALAHYQGFRHRGFQISLIFDTDPAKIGQALGGLEILDEAFMVPTLRQRDVRLAMLAVPAGAAQSAADKLVEAGVKGILNYAPTSLSVPEGVRVQHIDPVVNLQRMTYYL